MGNSQKVSGVTINADTNTGGFARRTYVLKPSVTKPRTNVKEAEVTQPKTLARALDQLWAALDDATRFAHSNPKSHGSYYKDIKFTNGQTVTLVHNMGKRCRYELTNVRDAAPNAYRAQTDEGNLNSISLTAGATFRADVHVYPDV